MVEQSTASRRPAGPPCPPPCPPAPGGDDAGGTSPPRMAENCVLHRIAAGLLSHQQRPQWRPPACPGAPLVDRTGRPIRHPLCQHGPTAPLRPAGHSGVRCSRCCGAGRCYATGSDAPSRRSLLSSSVRALTCTRGGASAGSGGGGSASFYEVKFSDTSKPNGQIWTGVIGSATATPPQRWFVVWLGTANDPVDKAAAKALAESIRPSTAPPAGAAPGAPAPGVPAPGAPVPGAPVPGAPAPAPPAPVPGQAPAAVPSPDPEQRTVPA